MLGTIVRPLQQFIRIESFGGILLLVCTAGALSWSNSDIAASYVAVRDAELRISLGEFSVSRTLLHWINDGLMAVFFFVVGLEIKREVLFGELASIRKSMLPLAGAIGGMVIPAAIFGLFNAGGPAAAGWGIPMATDIAFALGVLALLGKRIPLGLKLFLMALAIVDDLGAVLVIAFFYTADLNIAFLAWAAACFAMLLVIHRLNVQWSFVYLGLGFMLWVLLLKSGIHATVAGVLLATTIPGKPSLKKQEFISRGKNLLDELSSASGRDENEPLANYEQSIVQTLQRSAERVETPMQRLEHVFHPWVTYAILPMFALANAGVPLHGDFSAIVHDPLTLGIVFGLVLGKQIGITVFSWLSVKLRLAHLPQNVSWKHIYGVSWLGGIGFTMSLFVASLAFGESPLLDMSKVAVLSASSLAAIIGLAVVTVASTTTSKQT